MWTIFKVSIEFITILPLLFMFWFFFGQEACAILASQPEIVPPPSSLEGEVLTAGPPGKSLYPFSFFFFHLFLLVGG